MEGRTAADSGNNYMVRWRKGCVGWDVVVKHWKSGGVEL